MKKILILIAALTVAIPASAQLVVTQKKEEPIEKEKSVTTSFLDFRPYTTNGFFLSTSSYFGEYTAIGTLNIRIDPQTDRNKNRKMSDPLYLVEEVPAQEILNTAVETAKKMGADGIAELKIGTVEYTVGEIAISPPIKYYYITGLCISRRNAVDE